MTKEEQHNDIARQLIASLISIGEEGNLHAGDYDVTTDGYDLAQAVEAVCAKLRELREKQ